MSEEFDCAVLGSGIGGLAAALHVARAGRSTLLLEAAVDFGGMLNPFTRRRYEFDVGVHYVGQAGPGQGMRRTLDGLGLEDVRFREIDPDCIDRYMFDGYEGRLVKGLDRFIDRLVGDFPAEAAALRRFESILASIESLRKVATGGVSWRTVSALAKHPVELLRIQGETFGDTLNRHFRDPTLRAVFAGPGGDIGLPPGRASSLASMLVLLHYLRGAYYPEGGSGAMRDAFIAALDGRGVVRRNKTRVDRLRRIGSGWEIVAGEHTWRAKHVVSNIDAVDTIALLDGVTPPAALAARAARSRPSVSSVMLFIGTDLDLAAAGMTDANIWHYGTTDIDALYAPLLRGEIPEHNAFFLTAPTLKDPGHVRAPPGRHTLEVVSFAPAAPFRAHFDEPVMRRSAAYQDLKQRVTDQLLAGAERYVPGISSHLEVMEASTPASVWTYVRGRDGGIYGPEHSPDMIGPRRFASATGIDGLTLAGASVFGCGIYPCLLSGVAAGRAVLNR